jgi:hydroxymethylpyrimidine pyrophosphatase-like HAD family hydrolase
VLLALGIGDAAAVERVAAAITAAADGSLACARFELGDEWAIRVRRAECNKGAALARVAAALGVDRADVAAVGDWINDLEMLRWAARSFAMPLAEEEVKAAATDVLDRGVAEALARWLGW